jgi:hypothetical protein
VVIAFHDGEERSDAYLAESNSTHTAITPVKQKEKMNYSIVITTFDKRFEEFLVPLIRSIKRERAEVEIIITANGSAR